MSALFTLSNLTVRYARYNHAGQNILRGITTEIESGKFTVVIGPNGSGKSTLLRALAGLQSYGGSLTLNAQEIKSITRRQFAQTVGVVPQDFRPAYPFTVWEVIAMGRLPYRALLAGDEPDINARVLDAAERVGVSHLLERNVTTLSGGESQRVLLACVLAQNPPVMLLDEPTSALDPNQAVHVLALLRDLVHGDLEDKSKNENKNKNKNKTIIAVMHDVNVALAFADNYIALRDGVLCSSGAIQDLDGEVLKDLYGVNFELYLSERAKRSKITGRGDVMWRACCT